MDDFQEQVRVQLADLIGKIREVTSATKPDVLGPAVAQLPPEARAEFEKFTLPKALGRLLSAEEELAAALKVLQGPLPHGRLPTGGDQPSAPV